jgi:hypothetical protein
MKSEWEGIGIRAMRNIKLFAELAWILMKILFQAVLQEMNGIISFYMVCPLPPTFEPPIYLICSVNAQVKLQKHWQICLVPPLNEC